jgi:hypothetical protein
MVLRSFSVFIALAVVASAHSFGQSQSQPKAPQLILLDGSAAPFQSLDIKAGKLSGDGVPANLTLDDLRHIELSGGAPPAQEKSKVVVDLRGGGRVLSKSVSIATEKCQLQWGGGEPLSLPIDLIRAVRLSTDATSPDFDKSLAAPSAEFDRVFIKDEAGKLSSVTGLMNSLDSEQLQIEVGGQTHQVPRAKIFGIVVAQSAASDTRPRCLVVFRDGSTLGGEALSLTGDKAALTLPAGGTADFSWSAASRVIIRSSRVAFLSDLKPISEEQQPIVTLSLPAQRDKSASGKPLMLGTRTYEKGLGVHARSSLAFAADKKWDLLAATIGLDAAAGGKGDCVFIVSADGQPLLTRRLKGHDPAEEIQLSITGREQVTLTVEPGEGLDLADHADWCDVRFIKNRE